MNSFNPLPPPRKYSFEALICSFHAELNVFNACFIIFMMTEQTKGYAILVSVCCVALLIILIKSTIKRISRIKNYSLADAVCKTSDNWEVFKYRVKNKTYEFTNEYVNLEDIKAEVRKTILYNTENPSDWELFPGEIFEINEDNYVKVKKTSGARWFAFYPAVLALLVCSFIVLPHILKVF